MLSKIYSGAIVGLGAVPITVEVDIATQGLPSFTIVGLPDKAIDESKERVRAALKNSGADFPAKRITVNLAPADLPKEGPSYDLPIAIGILLSSGQLNADLSRSLVYGELSLDGSLASSRGSLLLAQMAQERDFGQLILPKENASEAAVIGGSKVLAAENLKELFEHFVGTKIIEPFKQKKFKFDQDVDFDFDMSDIKGQEQAKRALEIAAAGGHNLLFKGPPGAGKTLLARTFASILPKLTFEEAIEVTKISSLIGAVKSGMVTQRPFRSPHHTASSIGIIGGGTNPRPGEISQAHRGVLFLDEFPEFPRSVLEALRQPLEDGFVTVSRAASSVKFPAQFILIAASNPCPCGHFGDPNKECVCLPTQITRYEKRLSGPIMDRIDMHVHVPAVKTNDLVGLPKGESSVAIRQRVQKARDRQLARFKKAGIVSNSEMNAKQIKQFCQIEASCKEILTAAASQMKLSARGFYRVLKVAQTIADIEGKERIAPEHLAEALQYRSL
ncbi:MAG: magnesium chelatase [Candidatus Woykebacteria bacterium RIFCSPHIGHO2_12_FULL_45_10]|uniref:Magnesium chelatase n=1 Tax=Candidatus Woykebacteria bacterium RIFCSPHIGHO2_12_FULL_45_10 TaxID=1802603 RepID=A0A1G1WNR2_9BACT|nr:MAG: magnesium chelatase [Candidatus Woykebacteria bacterium RIFCSPHIGHO2_12_FULL_45_10]